MKFIHKANLIRYNRNLKKISTSIAMTENQAYIRKKKKEKNYEPGKVF